MARSDQNSFIEDLRRVIKDGIDYLQASVALIQARTADYALSGIVFIFLVIAAFLLGIAAFVFYNIALGCWLTDVLGSPIWSISILGSFYAILAIIAISIALRWLNTLKS